MTNVHKKLDRIMRKLSAVDETKATVKQIAQTNGYLAQMVGTLTQMNQRSLEVLARTNEIANNVALMIAEVKKSSDQTAEHVAEILAVTRKH